MSDGVEDEDAVLEKLIPYRADPTWHLRAEVDLKANVLQRAEQRAYLARYGRQDLFAPAPSIVAMNRAVRALSEVVQRENDLAKAKENQ